jgi:MFS transporter, DHA1 family, multidrug resistance protein
MTLMLFFWTLFDGLMSYVTPVIIDEHGFSGTALGLIIGSSSIAGAFFDFFLCRFVPNTNFRRAFIGMFILSALFPIIMLKGSMVWMFIAGMAVWGLYYDLYRIATYDFISRRPPSEEHAASFGIVQTFIALGYLLAPLVAGFLIHENVVGSAPIVASYLFLGIAFYLFILALFSVRHVTRYQHTVRRPSISFLREIRIWRKLGNKIRPVLALTIMINVVSAFYMTIGPLLTEELTELGPFGGIFMASEMLPMLIIGWFVGQFTVKFGKKRTAITSFLIGSVILIVMGFMHNAYLLIMVSFAASFFTSLAIPALNGAYADYISEARTIAIEIETMEDMSGNTGYVIGPILAGMVSDIFGYHLAFSFLGMCGIVVALYLYRITPKSINVAPLTR